MIPTKKQQTAKHRKTAILTIVLTSVLWIITYIRGDMFIYGFICPPLFLVAVWNAYLTLRDERSVLTYVVFIFSVIVLLLGLSPWFFPIAR